MFDVSDGGDRRVTSVSVDATGYVTHLWNDGSDWSPQGASEAILDRELGSHQYFVRWGDEQSDIVDGEDAGGRFLLSRRDGKPHNVLLDLPRQSAPARRAGHPRS
jgi:hypothetical protein